MTNWKPPNQFHGVIDCSHHNGVIDWPKVPPEFALVIIKATQGARFRDPRYVTNRKGAIDTGRMTMPYHFLTEAPIGSQLDHLVATTDIGSGSPVMVDWEGDPERGRRPSIETMAKFLDALEGVIQRPALRYHGMLDLSSDEINTRPWMLPRYRLEWPGPVWLFWQHTQTERVAGIPSNVDRSWFAGTLDELREWWKTGKLPSVDTPSTPLEDRRVDLFFEAATALHGDLENTDLAKKVQARLNAEGANPKLEVDSDFGRLSWAALGARLRSPLRK